MAYDVARFYPRLTSAARRTDLFLDLDERIVSIRASLQQRGELSRRIYRRSDARRFNPRLTSAARRTRYRAYYEHKYRVSIRASLQQRGERHGIEEQRRLVSSFNPRLTSAARRTRRETRSGEWKRLFQSAPHFSSEANARRHGPAGNFRGVSIRASLQQRGERADGSDLPAARRFNPRLTSAARRT